VLGWLGTELGISKIAKGRLRQGRFRGPGKLGRNSADRIAISTRRRRTDVRLPASEAWPGAESSTIDILDVEGIVGAENLRHIIATEIGQVVGDRSYHASQLVAGLTPIRTLNLNQRSFLFLSPLIEHGARARLPKPVFLATDTDTDTNTDTNTDTDTNTNP
jgi:hypothetical protein